MTMQMVEPLCEMFDVIDFYIIPVQLEAFLYLWKSKWSLLFTVCLPLISRMAYPYI